MQTWLNWTASAVSNSTINGLRNFLPWKRPTLNTWLLHLGMIYHYCMQCWYFYFNMSANVHITVCHDMYFVTNTECPSFSWLFIMQAYIHLKPWELIIDNTVHPSLT
jgi:hypothetical protein